jgi:hypothetical protein
MNRRPEAFVSIGELRLVALRLTGVNRHAVKAVFKISTPFFFAALLLFLALFASVRHRTPHLILVNR